MTIYELSILHDLELEVKHRNVRNCAGPIAPFYCKFNYSSTRRDIFLEGTYGDGKTPQEAINDYVSKLRGKILVVEFPHKPRLELNIPESLEIGVP